MIRGSRAVFMSAVAVAFTLAGAGQTLPDAVKAKAEAKAKVLAEWGKDPAVVQAVKAHNGTLSPENKAMTQEKWKSLSVLDPFVRSFNKNPLALWLKSKKDPSISEAFVSGADGTKAAFLSKTTFWSHKGKDKHEVPMRGHTWFGPIEVDESTGVQQLQVGVPILDGNKPIGSLVVGLKVSAL